MKLLFCRECCDVVKLQLDSRSCKCGRSRGYYLSDGWHAEVKGPAEVIGIANKTLVAAVTTQAFGRDCEEGITIKAWLMTRQHPRVKWVA